MRSIPFDFSDIRLPREVQLQRMKKVIARELTPIQREIILAVYLGGKTQRQIARERNVSPSTVCRTLRRAEERMLRCLRY